MTGVYGCPSVFEYCSGDGDETDHEGLIGSIGGRPLSGQGQGSRTKMDKTPQQYDIFRLSSTAGLVIDCRVGLHWHFCCGCPNSKPRPVLDFSSKKTRGRFIF